MRKVVGIKRNRAPQARYANYFEVGHNALEFVIDLGQYDPDAEACRLHTRIVTGPAYAKLLTSLLHSSIRQYEAENGEIHGTETVIDPLKVVRGSLGSLDSV